MSVEAALVPNITQIVAPVILISACGLLCSALYNRLATVVQRLRDFQRERLKEIERFVSIPEEERANSIHPVSTIWLNELNKNTPDLMHRMKIISAALIFFFICILCMIFSSLLLAFSVLLPERRVPDQVTLSLFVAGASSMAVGVLFPLLNCF